MPTDFSCPISCLYGVGEVFSGQYDFPGAESSGRPTILDIGANCGAFSAWAIMAKWPAATAIAYEPNPVVFDYLQRNCAPRVQCNNVAVGDPSLSQLHLGRNTPLCSSLYRGPETSTETIAVEVMPPEFLPVADIVKIDAEGAEAYIIEHLLFTPQLLAVEWHGDEQRTRIERALAGRMQLIGCDMVAEKVGLLKYIKA